MHNSQTNSSNSIVYNMIQESIKKLTIDTSVSEFGEVVSIADGIATVRGISPFLEEVIRFESGNLGIVKELLPYETKVVLFNKFYQVQSGMKAFRTNEELRVPVGHRIIGRVLDVFGEPIDGLGPINLGGSDNSTYLPIERPAPKMIDRFPVSKPLITGIVAIDSMIPIGLGQRELILGDMQTGKTSIAIGTILNQRYRYLIGDPIYCFYVAIGQKMDSIVEVHKKLKAAGAMEYTTIIAASAGDSAHCQFIAPYVGCTMAEYFMEQGKDCLVVYDDLSKHAVAHREISRLLGRPAGRDAYPADSFYIHARLLERAAFIREESGGGSMTALPIIETQDSDISGYISTNVISITDGQIVLDARKLDKPSIDIGLSVSRTGGSAQASATRKVSKSLKAELAQYSELVKFLQFTSGGLDTVQANILQKGKQTTYLLMQEEDERYTFEELILLIVGAHYRMFGDGPLDKKEVRNIKERFLSIIVSSHKEILDKIRQTGDISDEEINQVKRIAEKFSKQTEGKQVE